MRKIWLQIAVIIFFVSTLLIGRTEALFFDQETSAGNSLESGTFDFSLRDPVSGDLLVLPLFNAGGISPVWTETKQMRVQKEGSRDFQYRLSFVKLGGDDNLCAALQLEAVRGGAAQYSGVLSGLATSPVTIAPSGTDDWSLTLSLSNNDNILQGTSCQFKLLFRAFLPGSDGSWGFVQEKYVNNTVTTGCWAAPTAPALDSPGNGAAISASDVNFSWGAGGSSCPLAALSYRFQLYADAGLTPPPVMQSDWTTAQNYLVSALTEGNYWWRVEVKDQFDNLSASASYSLIADRTAPAGTLAVTGSWTKIVEEKITNGDFSAGLAGWEKDGDVTVLSTDTLSDPEALVLPPSGAGAMARLGRSSDVGNWLWENRLLQSFPAGAKSLSFSYNFFSRDDVFDSPGFLVRLNGQEVFRQNNLGGDGVSHQSTDWQNFLADLSTVTGSVVNLAIYAGNTDDKNVPSWVYIAKVTTYFVAAPAQAVYQISGSDGGSGVDHYEYQIDDGVWQTGDTFNISAGGAHVLRYKILDRAGNATIYTAGVVTDTIAPAAISDLAVSGTSANTAVLTWMAPGNDDGAGRAALYDVRYAAAEITAANFDSAAKVDRVPAPQEAGKVETLEIAGLDPAATYWFAVKSLDEAPNTSPISNVVSATTAAGSLVNPGDIVINELMWMGTAASTADEYLELRNLTGRIIDLSGLSLQDESGADMGISFAGKTIAPYGYFLITNYAPGSGNSSLKNTVAADITDTALILSNTSLQVTLVDSVGNIIDRAGDGGAPAEGLHETGAGGKYYSMERAGVPGEGADPLHWYTCIDNASTAEFFSGTADERGTPGAANRSENEPPAHQKMLVRPAADVSAQFLPEITLSLTEDRRAVSFVVANIGGYIRLEYVLTYETDSAPQGVTGSVNLDNQADFRKENILLGTCSAGGTCVYHSGVKNLVLTITLTDLSGKTIEHKRGYEDEQL